MNANQQTDRLMAQQRLADLQNAVGSGFNFLTQYNAPQKEVGLAQLGTLGGLASLTGANAQMAAQQSGQALDFLGGVFGTGLGAFTGGSGPGGAQSLFPSSRRRGKRCRCSVGEGSINRRRRDSRDSLRRCR